MINFFKSLFKKEENKNNKKEKTSIQNLDLKGLEKTYYENQLLENIEIPNPQDESSVKLHTTRGGHIKKLEIDATAIRHIVNEARLAKELDEDHLKRQKIEKLQKSMDDYANIIASKVLERARPKIQEAAEKLINEIEKRNKMVIKEEIEPIKTEITEIKTNIKEIKNAITGNLPKNGDLNEFNENVENSEEPELEKDSVLEEKEETEFMEIKETNNKNNSTHNLKEEKIETEVQQDQQVNNIETKTGKIENSQEQENPEDQIKAILQKAREKKQQISSKKEDTKKQNVEQNKKNNQPEKTEKTDTLKTTKANNTQNNKSNISQDEKEEKRKKKIEKIIKDIKANIKLIEGMKKIEEKEKELKILKQLINNEFKNNKEAIEIILKETNLEEIENKLKSIKEESEKINNGEVIDSQENKDIKDINIKKQKINYYLNEILKIKEHIESNIGSLKSQYIYMIVEKFKEKIEKEPNKDEILNAISPELSKITEIAKKKENDENGESQNKSKKTDIFDTTLEKNIKQETKTIRNLLEKTKEIRNLSQELIRLQETEMEKEENDSVFK
jgi:hypothetical protein